MWVWYAMIALFVASTTRAEDRIESSIRVPACVAVRGEARAHEHGFDHIVYVNNGCPVAVECVVSTTRDPSPTHRLTVPAGKEKGIITRTKARQPDFDPNVSCERRARAQASSVHAS